MKKRYFYHTEWTRSLSSTLDSVEEHAEVSECLIVSFQVLESSDLYRVIALMETLEEQS